MNQTILLTTQQLADRWGLTVGTLENWRSIRKGPKWIKIGGGSRGSVRYRLTDIESYEETMTPNKEQEQA